MPRQNRVTPFGQIVAIPERGTMLGNRGILHDETGHLRRAWKVRRWIVCELQFRGRKRTVMSPNSYTELFFLDEATALAAGHRPCAECRHGQFIDFCMAWKRAHGTSAGKERPTADEMDDRLHGERIARNGSKIGYEANLNDLPDGVFVVLPEGPDRAYLVRKDQFLEWTAGGYAERLHRPTRAQVRVLTPRSTVEVIRAGYEPDVHNSAGGFS